MWNDRTVRTWRNQFGNAPSDFDPQPRTKVPSRKTGENSWVCEEYIVRHQRRKHPPPRKVITTSFVSTNKKLAQPARFASQKSFGIKNEGGKPLTFSKAFLKSRMGSNHEEFPAKPCSGAAKGQSKPCGFLDFELRRVPNTEDSFVLSDLRR